MKIAHISGLLLTVLSLSAMASDWLLISKNDKSAMYVSVMNVSKHGKLMKAWFRENFKSPQTMKLSSKQYRSRVELQYFNCVERTSAVSRVYFYTGEDGSDEIVGKVYIPVDELQFSEVAFDTISETQLEFVCPRQ